MLLLSPTSFRPTHSLGHGWLFPLFLQKSRVIRSELSNSLTYTFKMYFHLFLLFSASEEEMSSLFSKNLPTSVLLIPSHLYGLFWKFALSVIFPFKILSLTLCVYIYLSIFLSLAHSLALSLSLSSIQYLSQSLSDSISLNLSPFLNLSLLIPSVSSHSLLSSSSAALYPSSPLVWSRHL